MGREQAVRVTLSDDELARLDELKPSGISRPAFLRSILHPAVPYLRAAKRKHVGDPPTLREPPPRLLARTVERCQSYRSAS